MKILFSAFFSLSIFLTWSQPINIPGISFYQSNLDDSLQLSYFSSIPLKYSDTSAFQITFKNSYNTAYPFGYNDGPVWKGKGLTTELHAGGTVSKGHFSFSFLPAVYFSQNLNFDLNPLNASATNPYGYRVTNAIGAGQIDWVQRFGNSPFISFHLGQTRLQYSQKHFHASIGTENFRLGPAVFNPLIMSNQGPGFPHLTIGTRPTTIKYKDFEIIKVEGTLIYGLLSESKYFNSNQEDNSRIFNTLELALSPVAILPNLKIGFQKAMYQSTSQLDLNDLYAPIKLPKNDQFKDSTTNDAYDQLASISMEWSFPSVGFRAYAEFAKNDFTGKGRWTLLEPEHSRAYTLGFEKRTKIGERLTLDMIYEHSNLSINHSYLWRAEPSFYSHPVNIQGYTHQGQLLGAGIGPGGTSDQVNFLLKSEKRQLGFYLQRVENNKDYLIRVAKSVDLHDILFAEGLYYQENFNRFNLIFESTLNQNYNRYNILFNDQNNFYCSMAIQAFLSKK